MTGESAVPSDGFTVKEIILSVQHDVKEIDGKLDDFLDTHQKQHVMERDAFAAVRAAEHSQITGQITDTRKIVDRHDVLIQRLIGATSLASFLGLGALFLWVLRVTGVLG